MKNHVAALMTLFTIMTCICLTGIAAAEQPYKVIINGEVITFDKAPVTYNGSLFVQIRPVLSKLRMDAHWDQKTQTLVAERPGVRLQMTAGDRVALIDGEPVSMSLAPRIIGGDFYVPLTIIAFAVNMDYIWSEETGVFSLRPSLLSTVLDTLYYGNVPLQYEGSWDSPERGTGKIKANGLLWYEGEFKNGKLEGYGKLYQTGRVLYEGLFSNNLPDELGKYYLANGETYKGEFEQGRRNGKGRLYAADKLIYDGEWQNDTMYGIGTIYNNDGKKIYSGHFSGNQRNGYGVLFNEAGNKIYEGNWKNGEKNGYGKSFALSDGKLEYGGNWEHDRKNGEGTAYSVQEGKWYTTDDEKVTTVIKKEMLYMEQGRFLDGEQISIETVNAYAGSLDQDGSPNGRGQYYVSDDQTMTTEAGAINGYDLLYDGEVVNGRKQGRGELYENNLLVYDGQFINDLRDGYGLGLQQSILEYKGYWKQGKKHGQGTIYEFQQNISKFTGTSSALIQEVEYRSGVKITMGKQYKYFGEVADGMMNGVGATLLIVDPAASAASKTALLNGAKGMLYYEGNYVDGRQEGFGKLYTDGRLSYAGSFVDDRKNGFGTLYNYAGGKVFEGNYVNDKRDGAGKIYNYGLKVYEGEFKDDLMHGYGKLYQNGRLIYEGQFINGTKAGQY